MKKTKQKNSASKKSKKGLPKYIKDNSPVLVEDSEPAIINESAPILAAESQASAGNNWVLELYSNERNVFSQAGQDGIIEHVFKNIKPRNEPPFCVGIGYRANDLATGEGTNTANLRNNHGWRGLLLDGQHENQAINLHKAVISSETICDILAGHGVPSEPDYISINMDSYDLWLLKAILGKYQPLLISSGFNSNFPLRYAIAFPDDPNETWQGDSVCGSSLKALALVADEFAYKPIYVADSAEVFFVRGDVVDGLELPALEHFWEQIRPLHDRCGTGREKLMLDYEVFTRTHDLTASRVAAEPICVKYLVDSSRQIEASGSGPSVTESDFIGQAQELIQANRPEAALEEIEQGLARYPASAPLLCLRGRICQRKPLSRFADAEDSFQRAMAIIPWYHAPYQGLAQVAKAQGEWLTALQRWDACLEKFPSHKLVGSWQAGRGHLLINLSRYDEAERAYEQAVTLPESQLQGYSGLAQCATLKRDWPAAIGRWRACLKCSDNPRETTGWRLNLATALVRAGQLQEAETEYQTILEVEPGNPKAASGLAKLKERLNTL